MSGKDKKLATGSRRCDEGAKASDEHAERGHSRFVEVTEKDLPLHCPTPAAPLWARHPRVFLD